MDISIFRSGRKSCEIRIRENLTVAVRVPYGMSDGDIRKFIEEKKPWIDEHLEIMKKRLEEREKRGIVKLTGDEINKLTSDAKKDISKRCEFYADKLGVQYNRITIRRQVSRWGSCSKKGNLSFNCILMLCPEKIRDYVVIHELCHILEFNHSPKFWETVEKFCPDYKENKKWLNENAFDLIERI